MKLLALSLCFIFSITGCEKSASGYPEQHGRNTRIDSSESVKFSPDPIFDQAMKYAQDNNLHEKPIGEVMQAIGLFFKGKPYVAGMLDEAPEETLVCRLDGFDCVTFVETILAMARGIKDEDYSYSTFKKNLEDQRYRGGKMDGYCSRLHYFSEWIVDNEKRGNVENITGQIGGVEFTKPVDFMTSHRQSYPRLAANDETYNCIVDMEKGLKNEKLLYVPKNNIRETYSELKAGDILGLTTSIKGLDITHTGLVYDAGNGKIGLLHASTTGGVKVSPDLYEYVKGITNQTGMMVARPE